MIPSGLSPSLILTAREVFHMNATASIYEPGRDIPLLEEADVIVCGAGPAGIAAALAAARTGARTTLLEVHGCLGGVWTAGLLSWVIDSSHKPGIMREIIDGLDKRQARSLRVPGGKSFAYDVEQMKLLLEEMITKAGIRVQLHTRVVAAIRDEKGRRISIVLTESKSGRQAWAAKCFVDASGDGDLAAQAGCGFDLGRPGSGECQPMSHLALVTGVHAAEIEPFIGGGLPAPKQRLLAEFARAGVIPSYTAPTLFCIRDDLFAFMGNHEYGTSALDARQITEATLHARAEIHGLVAALKSLGAPWSELRVIATAEHIGVREGRRIHGIYMVGLEDMVCGIRHTDAVCRVNFGIDVHATTSSGTKSYDSVNTTRTKPYDIPLRALIAKDVDNLLLAGRCISGDFVSHASYRVTGNAVALGQGAGVAAALAARQGLSPSQLAWSRVRDGLAHISQSTTASKPGLDSVLPDKQILSETLS